MFDKVIRELKKKNKNQALVRCITPKRVLLGYWGKRKDGNKVYGKNTLSKMEVTDMIKNVLLLKNQSDYDGFSQFYELMLERDEKNRVSLNDDVLSVVRGFLTHENPLCVKQLSSGKTDCPTQNFRINYYENSTCYCEV